MFNSLIYESAHCNSPSFIVWPSVTLWGAPSLSAGSILINNVAVSLCVISIDWPCTEQAASYWLGFGSAVCVDGAQSLIAVETWELLKQEALALQRDLGCLSGSLMIISMLLCHQIVRKKGNEQKEIWRSWKYIESNKWFYWFRRKEKKINKSLKKSDSPF